MAKKQAQFRFDEEFYATIGALAQREGITLSEIVRDAIRLYLALHERTREGSVRLFLEYDDPGKGKCEVVLPWIQFRSR